MIAFVMFVVGMIIGHALSTRALLKELDRGVILTKDGSYKCERTKADV